MYKDPKIVSRPGRPTGAHSMDAEDLPGCALSCDALARIVRDIDQRDVADGDALLRALLCAAWPTLAAQYQ